MPKEARKVKKVALLFSIMSILLSDTMRAVIAYVYQDMLCGIAHMGYSAPANVAFLYAIPFIIAIMICIVLAAFFYRKTKNDYNR